MGTRRTRSRGQGLVEFVLIAPLLLLLLLATVEFGRAFMGWVAINNASRVAASYAATHPDDWPTSDGTQPASYRDAIDASLGWLNCTLDDPAPEPHFGAVKRPGSIVRVTFTCRYSIATPVLNAVLGNEVPLSASTAYPITGGCIANCGPSTATPPPGSGAESGCRAVPALSGLSVLGARTAWVNAGFLEENFSTDVATPTRTVEQATVTDDPAAPPCPGAQRFFTAAVSVAVEEPPPPPTPTCQLIPNLLGMTVADARDAWEALGWGGLFTPTTTERDHHIVFAQVTDPVSAPGDCVEPDPPFAGVEVAYAPPPPPPPAAPCQVPSLVNTVTGTPADPTGAALGEWTGAGFTGELTFHNDKLPWMIKAQSLVGGTYQACDASMEVRR